jgi:hypothetical protein
MDELEVAQLLSDTNARRIKSLETKLEATERQNALFMYRILHIIEVASLTRETNPAMQEIMDLAAGKNDAEMIEQGIV